MAYTFTTSGTHRREGPAPGTFGAAPADRAGGVRCVTPGPEFLGWPESLGAAVPRGGHHP